jgi:extradiol dioxygenase family protein
MLLNHIGIVNASEEQAGKFYGEFLELKKSREYVVPSELSEQLFKIKSDIQAVVYERDDVRLEIFIYPDSVPVTSEIRHVALFVDDLTSFLERAVQFKVEHIIGKTSEKTVHFIKDYSGNMIEVKQKP